MLHEENAVKLLRALIGSPPTTLANGRPDPGWCCNEHSVIASLAFVICRIETFLCRGALMLGDAISKIVLDVEPHWFIIVAGNGVFDSSLTSGEIYGLPTSFKVLYPKLAVRGGEQAPSRAAFLEYLNKSKKDQLAWYSSSKMSHPARQTVEWISTTPFGQWLTDRYGSQAGIWGKAAWIIADVLRGRSLPVQTERDALWDFIVSTPDRNDAVITLCSAATDET